jgi:hypothetical protein
MEEIMIDGHIVYSNTELTDADGVQTISHHTYAIYVVNKDTNHWVEVKLNGKHSVVLPDSQGHVHDYVEIAGDYNTIEVVTASSTVAVYAIG